METVERDINLPPGYEGRDEGGTRFILTHLTHNCEGNTVKQLKISTGQQLSKYHNKKTRYIWQPHTAGIMGRAFQDPMR